MKRIHVILVALLSGALVLWNACSDDPSSPLASVAATPSIAVAGGTFQMGYANGNLDERPVHSVTVSSFSMDKYEVTVAQYRVFCTATGRAFPPAPRWGWNDNDPIVNVSWDDANAYAAWMGKRLPTEAEWEYAARGGLPGIGHNYPFSGSSDPDSVMWYSGNSGGRPHQVGTKMGNELGIHDMSGNVWEFVNDWYAADYYSVSPTMNPQGPSTGTWRVLRGSSWCNLPASSRLTMRIRIHPSQGDSLVGFRCVQILGPPNPDITVPFRIP